MKLKIGDIPGYETFIKIEPIDKGWSGDKKYYIETDDGQKLVLRVSDIKKFDEKKAEYDAVAKAATLGSHMAQPFGFGTCGKEKKVYYLVSWLEGKDAAEAMKKMPDAERYALGVKAGNLLRALHTLPAPDDAEPWERRFARKMKGRLSDYHKNKRQKSKEQIERGELAKKYLEDNAELSKHRRQTFCHGDFNRTNIIVAPSGEVGAIDFACDLDKENYGDPLFDFIHIIYTDALDPHYFSGLWNGYAGGVPDDEFFAMTAYYFAYDAFSSLGGNKKFDNGGFDKKVLVWYDNFNRVVPSWYLGSFQSSVG